MDYNYTIKKNKRSKNLRIKIKSKNDILVTIPYYISYKQGEIFLKEKESWILKHLSSIKENPLKFKPYKESKKEAKDLIIKKLNFFNAKYNFQFNKVFIRNQSTIWGSCSSNKNLNFNYKILFLKESLQDYLIVHELCHLQEMNHSKQFYSLIEKTIPNYKSLQKELKKYLIN
jgi:predicted metal-dependent hydrolase